MSRIGKRSAVFQSICGRSDNSGRARCRDGFHDADLLSNTTVSRPRSITLRPIKRHHFLFLFFFLYAGFAPVVIINDIIKMTVTDNGLYILRGINITLYQAFRLPSLPFHD